jgi:DNA mismatch repair ATPase MutS
LLNFSIIIIFRSIERGDIRVRSVEQIYERRKKGFEKLIKEQQNVINFISILRLIIFAAGVGFAIYFYLYKRYYFSVSLILVTLTAFIMLVVKHNAVIDHRSLTTLLRDVNDISIRRLKGQWREFSDLGEDFRDTEHNYSDDLDVFGKSSVFQWINTAVTPFGRKKLKDLLKDPSLKLEDILKRQMAVKELSDQIGWRQRLESECRRIPKEKQDSDELINWSVKREAAVDKFYLRAALILLPMLTIASIIYYFIRPSVGYSLPLIFIIIDLLVLKLGSRVRSEALDTAYKYKKNIRVYYKVIKHIEEKRFNAELLNNIKGNLIKTQKDTASKAIEKLIKITDKISDRNNIFSIVLNILFLWDYHLVIQLERWKRSYGKSIEKWLQCIGEFEALSSLAVIGFDNPKWAKPNFINDKLSIEASDLAHPLLSQTRISNDASLGKPSNILLITGSNMSGKSTYLRTIGLNLVLAYAGTPVCAKSFSCSLMNIYTCMRISDNLEKNISSFYAEIIRIKKIVSAANKGEPIFFLLDEIFKGTNSLDRHLGAETLINKLSRENTLGLVSTHDLELGELEDKNPKIKNYNFQEYYKDNQIYFDYKLRPGVSTTRNAIYLMKLAGIEFDT